MKIGTRDVGPGHRTFVIAEVGSNWAGSITAAFALIDAAADAGADCVKFQAGHADHVYDVTLMPEEYASFKRWVEPTLAVLPFLKVKCDERGIEFMCSSFCLDALDEVDRYVPAHKIASIESQWPDFCLAVLNKDKPMIVSTGMRNDTLTTIFTDEVVFLGCTVSYPCDLKDAHIASMPRGDHMWGLSDHTLHPTIAPCAAVSLGACVIEKHIRPSLAGASVDALRLAEMTPDWPHSLSPARFGEMVDAIRMTEQALGSAEKRIRPSEEKYLKYRRGPRGLRGA